MPNRIRVSASSDICGVTQTHAVLVSNRRTAAAAKRWATAWGLCAETCVAIPRGERLFSVSWISKRDDLFGLRTADEVRAIAADVFFQGHPDGAEFEKFITTAANVGATFHSEHLDVTFAVKLERLA